MNYALITGASSGIGLELARIHASQKGNLILVARNEASLTALKTELEARHGITVRVIQADLSRQDAAQQVYNTCMQEGWNVHILINNAGFGDFGRFHELELQRAEQMIELNIMALTRLTRMFLPKMVLEKSGKIMNVASTAAFQPGPNMAVYFATKAYVLHFSEAIATELKGTGVSVTALCPGPTISNFQVAAAMEDSKLFNGKKLPSALEVARFGYSAMLKGRMVAVHGFMNRSMAAMVGFLPRKMVMWVVRKMQ